MNLTTKEIELIDDNNSIYYGGMGCITTNKQKTKLYIVDTKCSDNNSINIVIIYDILTKQTINVTSPLNYKHCKGGIIATSDTLYVFGGSATYYSEYIDLHKITNNTKCKNTQKQSDESYM